MHILYAATGGTSFFSSSWIIVVYIAFFVGIWYFMIRPQSVQQRKHQDLVKNLKKGDRVITSGGLHGIVVDAQEDVVVLRVAPKMDLTVQKSSISSVVGKVSQDDQKRLEREKAPAELDAGSVEADEKVKPS